MLAVSMSPPIAHYPAVQKRPKLSLKTSELPITYGTSSRNLSTIATPTAAVTPTTLNTFSNTFDLTHRPSPTSATASPSILRSTPACDHLSRSQSPRPKKNEAVYTINLPYGIKPILKNTPYPRVRTNSISASPRSNTRRVFFPAPKQVVFKNTIEEEVVTKLYTARHSDLFQQGIEEDVNNTGTDNVDQSNEIDTEIPALSEQLEEGSSISISGSTLVKRLKSHVDYITSTHLSVSSADNESGTVATPSSTRKCRKWEWTLAPISTALQPNARPEPDAEPSSISASASKRKSLILSSTVSNSECGTESALITPRSSCQAQGLNPTEPEPNSTVSAQPHPYPQLRLPKTTSSSTSQSDPLSTSLSDYLSVQPIASKQSHSAPSSPPLSSSSLLSLPQPHPTKRAGSLDSSPRKRKADCLDISTGISGIDASGESPSGADDSDATGRTGTKRRERAATL